MITSLPLHRDTATTLTNEDTASNMTHAITKASLLEAAASMRPAHPSVEEDDLLLCLMQETREKRRSCPAPSKNASVASSDTFQRRPNATTGEGQGESEEFLLDIMRQKRQRFQEMQG